MMPLAKDFKTYPTFDKKPAYDSNISNNEVVKNNKAYRIRTMYQPKIWVIQIEVTDTDQVLNQLYRRKFLSHLCKVIKHYQEVMVVLV